MLVTSLISGIFIENKFFTMFISNKIMNNQIELYTYPGTFIKLSLY